MKDYFKRLKDHPGVMPATVLSVFFFLAAGSNPSIHGVWILVAGGAASGLIWSIVLTSNLR